MAAGVARRPAGGRGRLVALAALACVCMASLLAAPRPGAAQEGPSAAYLAAVERYAAGDRAGALEDVAAFSARAVRQQLESLRGLLARARACPGCLEASRARRLNLVAALLLHTDAFLPESAGERARERDPETVRAHRLAASGIADLLRDEPQQRDLVRRWYAAVAGVALASASFEDAVQWARRGLAAFADAPELLLVVATVEEWTGAQGGLRDLAGAIDPSTPQMRDKLALFRERRRHLERAQEALARALAVDPALDAARLRLGRVAWRLGDAAAARTAFEQVLERTGSRGTAYLAHLFLGRVHEDAGHFDEAAGAYAAAVALDADSQAARLALSHARLRLGDAAAARRELEAAVGFAGWRREPDPFWDYPWGPGAGAAERLEALRREASS